MTVPRFNAVSILSVTAMPKCPAPEISPASLPTRRLPGLSTAPASAQPVESLIARITAPPMRPPTPQTMIPSAMKFLEQAEIAHRLGELFQVAFAHRRQRQAQIARAFAHE